MVSVFPSSGQTANVGAMSEHFDVVSIRASDPKSEVFSVKPVPDDFSVQGATVVYLLQYAYDLSPKQILHAPAWARTTRFDLKAKVVQDRVGAAKLGWEAGQAILRKRLRNLLAERCHLQAELAKKSLPVYFLDISKGGPKLKVSSEDVGYTAGRGLIHCSNTSMSDLAYMLSGWADRIVVDRTGLSGGYAFELK